MDMCQIANLSIIITTFNDWEYIRRTIASCFMQDVWPEIVVVNDGGHVFFKVDDFIRNAWCTYVELDENVGLAEARDAGIKKARNDNILPLDTVDWLHVDVLGDMLCAFDGGVDVVYGNMTVDDVSVVYKPPGKDGITVDGMKKINQLWCTSMFRKSIWEKVGGYSNGLHTSYEDYFYFCKCLMAGAKFQYIDKTIYNHTHNPNSMLSKLHKNTDYYNNLARQPLFGDGTQKLYNL